MAETSTSSECGREGKPELSQQGVALGHAGSGNGRRSAPMVGQTHTQIPRLGLFELPRRLSAGLPLQPICEMRAFLCIVGVVMGVFGSTSSALAEVEEATSQDGFVSDYNQSAFTHDFIVSFASYYSNITAHGDNNNPYLSAFHNNEAEFREYNTGDTSTITGRSEKAGSLENIDDVLIPATVWSLDVSTGVHLDHISSYFGYDLDILLGNHQRTHDFWMRMILGLRVDQSTDKPSDAIPFSPLLFQVASCGGSSAEHRDLDLCNANYISTNLNADSSKQDNSTNITIAPAPNNSSDAAIGPSNSSTPSPSPPNLETQPDTVLDLSPLVPASVNNFAVPGDLLSTLPDQCDDTSASCTITQITPIDAPTTPIDSAAPPDITPQDPVIYIGDPGPVSDPLPIFTPPPASPVPETSTEVMTMIGFGIMALVSRGRALNSIKHGVVGAFYKITKKSLHHYSA
jgi:hypothetical protein